MANSSTFSFLNSISQLMSWHVRLFFPSTSIGMSAKLMGKHLSEVGRRSIQLPLAPPRWVQDTVKICYMTILVMGTGERPHRWVSCKVSTSVSLLNIVAAVSFLQKIKEAVGKSNDHKFLHHQFVLGLPEASVKKWEWELGEWEETTQN